MRLSCTMVHACFLLISAAALTLMVADTAGASSESGSRKIELGPIFRGRTLLQSPGPGREVPVGTNRGRFPECANNRTVCLDRRLTPDGPNCCNNRCVNSRNDTNHCGRCFSVCGFAQGCCSGRCVNLLSDPQNCGACDVICNDGCIQGLCSYNGL